MWRRCLGTPRPSPPGLYCDAGAVSVKIDASTIPAPIKESVKVADLDLAPQHRIVVSCGGKPQQSFTRRFSRYQTNDLCFFLNDLYKTAQLWENKACPWCKCR